MYPVSAFRSQNHALMLSLIDGIGCGMAFAAMPDGPRMGDGALMRGQA